jgi:hypothetical protein
LTQQKPEATTTARDRPTITETAIEITPEMLLAGGQVLVDSAFLEDTTLRAEQLAGLVRRVLCAALDRSPTLAGRYRVFS